MDVSAVGYLDSGLRRKDGVGCCRDDAVTPLIQSLSKDLHECDSENSSLNLITCYFDQLDGEEFQVPQSVTRSLSTKAVKDSAPLVINDCSSF